MTQDHQNFLNESYAKSINLLNEQTKNLQQQVFILEEGMRQGNKLVADAIEKNLELVLTMQKVLAAHGITEAREIGLRGLMDEALGKHDEKDL